MIDNKKVEANKLTKRVCHSKLDLEFTLVQSSQLKQKSAMFGLDARKMSVKKIALNVLFLANLRRLSFRLVGGDSYFYKSQIAAMFGLDARIALAIFGALSVITGAALYKAIGSSKTTALLTEMQEVGKAWEQYYLDTGQDLPMHNEPTEPWTSFMRETNLLVEKPTGVNNWNGPYLNHTPVDFMLDTGEHKIHMVNVNDTVWGNAEDWSFAGHPCTAADNNCYIWIEFNKLKGYNLNILDKQIDKSDGFDKGSFRVVDTGGASSPRAYYKYAPVPR